jgi:hypothetical protein
LKIVAFEIIERDENCKDDKLYHALVLFAPTDIPFPCSSWTPTATAKSISASLRRLLLNLCPSTYAQVLMNLVFLFFRNCGMSHVLLMVMAAAAAAEEALGMS